MDLEQARNIVGRVQYKEGFRIQILRHEMLGKGYLHLAYEVPDSNDPRGRYGTISKSISVNLHDMTDSELVHTIFKEILNWEHHEACEFFTFEGVRIFNPHADVHILKQVLQR